MKSQVDFWIAMYASTWIPAVLSANAWQCATQFWRIKLRKCFGADDMSWVKCCFLDNKVHPLENVLDPNELSLDESHMTLEVQYSSQVKHHANLSYCNPEGLHSEQFESRQLAVHVRTIWQLIVRIHRGWTGPAGRVTSHVTTGQHALWSLYPVSKTRKFCCKDGLVKGKETTLRWSDGKFCADLICLGRRY